MNSIWAVIPAAGAGSRMQSKTPKQYLPLLGKPVITHSLELFLDHPSVNGIVLSLGENDPFWPDVESSLSAPVHTVVGGNQRAHSVLNGLNAVPDKNAWVLVHDAARPCLTRADLDRLIQSKKTYPNGAILGHPLVDTLKCVSRNGVSKTDDSKSNTLFQWEPHKSPSIQDDKITIKKTFDRSAFFRALTPQFAPLDKLRLALQSIADKEVTDESQAMELAGYQMGVIVGRSDNIKITYEQDLALAEFLLEQQVIQGLREST